MSLHVSLHCYYSFLSLTSYLQGCTIYKQDDAVFIGKLLKGCDAEASGRSPNTRRRGTLLCKTHAVHKYTSILIEWVGKT